MYIPSDPSVAQTRINQAVRYTLQMITAIIIALEVAIPPNPYKTQLIVVLTIGIAHKYHLVDKTLKSVSNLINGIKKVLYSKR